MLKTPLRNHLTAFFLFLRGGIIIISILMIGKLMSHLLQIPIPGSIIGLLLLFTALASNLINIKLIDSAGHFLLKYMTLFFVPAGVGLINHIEILSQHWLVIVSSSLLSTIVVLISVGLSYQKANQE